MSEIRLAGSTHQEAAASARRKLPFAGVVVSLVFGIASVWLFTRNNDFPIEYHPDEQGKAAQVIVESQPRNFNQPLMMLEAANVARKAFGGDETRPIVIAGRWTSAFFAATAVLVLALAGCWKGGLPAIALGGLTMALCPPLLVYAHYFKEDTALVVGIAIALAGAKGLVCSRRIGWQIAAAAALGAGCAAAASGKYLGLVTLAPALLALAIAPTPRWWIIPTRVAVFLAVMGILVMLIDARAFQSFFPPRLLEIAKEQIVTEFHHGTTGHDYLALDVPNFYCLRVASSELMPHIWIFLAVGLGVLAARRNITRWGIVLAAFLLTFLVALSLNTIPFGRYALPLSVMFYFTAAQLVAAAVSGLGNPAARNAAWAACLGAVVLFQGYRCMSFSRQFANDSRQQVREWIARQLPGDAVIVEDRYVLLEGPGDPERFPNQTPVAAHVERRFLAADAAVTLDEMAASGIGYVAVAETNYQRFFEPGAHGLFPREEDFERRRRFYSNLFARGELVWHSRPAPPTHAYVNPEIRLYCISHILAANAVTP